MTDKPQFKLYFCSKPNYDDENAYSVYIYPDSNNFNDFGLDSKIFIKVIAEEKQQIILDGFLGYIYSDGVLNGKHKLINRNKNQDFYVPSNDEKPYSFFTMLRELKNYRSLVEFLGPTIAIDVCYLINDISLPVKKAKNQKYKDEALNTDIFSKSFIRNSESYFSFKNSRLILKGLDFESKNLLSKNITLNQKKVEIPTISFDFDHDNILPKRVSIIIGENGVGKSQTLKNIALSALNGSSDIFSCDNGEVNRLEINRLLAFSPTNESKSVFPSDKRSNAKIWYKRFSLNRTPSRAGIENTNDLIVQLSRSDERLFNTSRFDIFLKAIKNLNNAHELHLPTKNTASRPIAIEELINYGEEKTLLIIKSIDTYKDPVRVIEGKTYNLSSGEISFLKFCAQICANIENGTLVLLDEPETHLHPAFINKFFSLLDSLLSQTGSSAILATHSVYFVREVFKEQVIVMRKIGHQVKIEKPRLSTFGANIGNISYFVFGESEPTDALNKVKNKIIKEKLTWQEIYDTYSEDLSINALTMLRNAIEDKKGK